MRRPVEVKRGSSLFSRGKKREALIETHAAAICAGWQKTVQGILDTAAACCAADQQLSRNAKKLLYRQLPFNRATFSKLAKIGDDKRVYDEKVKPLLPPHYGTIYETCKLSDDQLKQAIETKVLNPRVERTQIIALRKQSLETRRRTPRLPDYIYVGIVLPREFSDDQHDALQNRLEQLTTEFGVNLVFPGDDLSALREYGPPIGNERFRSRSKGEDRWRPSRPLKDFSALKFNETEVKQDPDEEINELLAEIEAESKD